ncbi:nucleoid-associated protein [Pseudoalteromonas luteoviolacea]|uniref:Nucleoid-associated protein NdpA n=1 Tax=Pseudoalteromonas luteoviolacea S4060-1 TaxID=1365257 RepID=A0A162BB49_9GAMM|nr:nucleoid-associated protein [Pseudoalteromonas luteoviolacea]KZN69443.1 hypothetical protein N478_12480 [Pseudoalteromonas luteoviolacea S4060-1]
MEDFNLESYSIHHINLEEEKHHEPEQGEESDIETLSRELLTETFDSKRGQEFKFASDTEEVAILVSNMANGGWEDSCTKIADRLLRSELSRQEELGNFQQVAKGSLLQLKVTNGEELYIIFTKVDHNKFVDERDSLIHFGIPFKKRVQKTCIFKFSEDLTPVSIKIFDSNSKISKYWRKDFLCCEAIRSPVENTKSAFSAIDNTLSRNLKKQSKPDYTYLRNNIITYFRSNESIAFDDFVENVVRNYVPINSEVDMGELAEKISALPESKGFDTQFDVDTKSINARIRRVVVLAENFELNIKGEVPELESLVDTGSDALGKYLKIYSPEGHDEFNRIKRHGQ